MVGKMRKRILPCICILALILVLPVVAGAAGASGYTIDEIGMTIAIPDDFAVFTRDMRDNDPLLIQYGLTKTSMLSAMNSDGSYLVAFDKEVTCDIVVSMEPSPLEDFSAMNDLLLDAFSSAFSSAYENLGMTVTKTESYHQGQTKFAVIHFNYSETSGTVYSRQYVTVHDGKAIYIAYHSYAGQITPAAATMLQGVIDSIGFSKGATPVRQTPAAAGNVYIDPATGASFTIPDNWTEVSLLLSHELLCAKFKSIEDINLSITYGYADLWSNMSSLERRGSSRSDINGSYYSTAEIASLYGVPTSEVKKVTYGGNTFYIVFMTESAEAYGFNVTITMAQAVTLSNGYMYIFQFNDSADNSRYSDFEALLSSVKLP